MWAQYKNPKLNPLSTLEIANSKDETCKQTQDYRTNGYIVSFQNCKSTINQNWDLKNYPFDKQKLEIVIEESFNDTEDVVVNFDKKYTQDKKSIDIKGWNVNDIFFEEGNIVYNTDFGDFNPTGTNVYPYIKCTLELERNSSALFFKLFIGVYVAFLVSWLVFFIRPIYVDPRFGLSIGGLFAAVGNKYVVDANIPENISFTLVDKIHDVTFVFILLSLVFSVVSLRLHDSGNYVFQKKFDQVSALTFLALYLVINIVSISNAIYH
jgi:hypothetical protein